MEEIEGLIQQVSKVKDGFKPIQAEAENILAQYPTIGTASLEALSEVRIVLIDNPYLAHSVGAN